jgi:hypothetical protein
MRGTPENCSDWVIKALEEKDKEHAEACREEFCCSGKIGAKMEITGEAKERLRHAIELDKEARKLALEDEDLTRMALR